MGETEPRVVTADVRAALRRAIRPEDPDDGDRVQLVAERARTSTRTIYRVLGCTYAETMSLSLADRLMLASGSHLMHCRLVVAGETVDYLA